MGKLLSLVMIVKNEATSIRSVLEMAKPFVDKVTILDTGSDDGTQKIVLETLDGVAVNFRTEEFIDFSTTRNRALEIDAATGDPTHFQLMLSGDEYLTGGDLLRALLADRIVNNDTELFRLQVLIDGVSFRSPRIFRVGSAWKYEGVVDEIPVHADPAAPCESLQGPSIEHVISNRDARLEAIWTKQIPLLEAKLDEEPNDTRALSSLAQKYEAFLFGPGFSPGERITYAFRAMSLYVRRLALGGMSVAEENYYKMRYLTDARLTGMYSSEEMLSRVKELADQDPQRPETALLLVHAASRVMPVQEVYALAAHAAVVASAARNIPNDSPVSTEIEWQAHYIAAKCAKQVAAKHPDASLNQLTFAELVEIHVKQGIASGGDREQFDALLEHVANGSNGVPKAIAQ